MKRPPPRSTLCPYTTLFRSDDDLVAVLVVPGGVPSEDHRQLLLAKADAAQGPQVVVVERGGPDRHRGPDRKSTRPELQSRQYLVCRLLLEKKKQLLYLMNVS